MDFRSLERNIHVRRQLTIHVINRWAFIGNARKVLAIFFRFQKSFRRGLAGTVLAY